MKKMVVAWFLKDENKKKVSRIIGWGLRRFSKIVCQMVQAKGMTTYNEVADEIIANLAILDKANEFEFDEKNIRRRVYDAFNVLLAINVIAKDKKDIYWIGFPNSSTKALEDLKKKHMTLRNRIIEKANYLKDLEAKAIDYRKLITRNRCMHGLGSISSEDKSEGNCRDRDITRYEAGSSGLQRISVLVARRCGRSKNDEMSPGACGLVADLFFMELGTMKP